MRASLESPRPKVLQNTKQPLESVKRNILPLAQAGSQAGKHPHTVQNAAVANEQILNQAIETQRNFIPCVQYNRNDMARIPLSGERKWG